MLLLIDLEGTLYDRGQPIPGAVEAVAALREAGHTLRFCTNIDARAPGRVVEAYGKIFTEDELFTPVVAARHAVAGGRVLVVGSQEVEDYLGASREVEDATHVVVGDCRERLDYALLDAGFRAVRKGAELLALQRGRYFRGADGDHLDAGAIVAALEYATQTTARVLGKPSVDFLRLAAASTGVSDFGDIWVVGDDRTTDVRMAHDAGARAVLVRTGKYADQRDLPEPSLVVDSIAEVPGVLAARA